MGGYLLASQCHDMRDDGTAGAHWRGATLALKSGQGTEGHSARDGKGNMATLAEGLSEAAVSAPKGLLKVTTLLIWSFVRYQDTQILTVCFPTVYPLLLSPQPSPMWLCAPFRAPSNALCPFVVF